jgi:hypothetical protein
MDVDNIRSLGAQQFGKLVLSVAIPDRLLQKHQSLDAGVGVRLKIASAVQHNLVSSVLQHMTFLVEYDVFAAGLLVMTMNENDLHS